MATRSRALPALQPPAAPSPRRAARRHARRRSLLLALVAGTGVGVLTATLLSVTGFGTPSSPAAAVSDSAVTVSANQQDTDLGTAPFPELAVTVSQTRDLEAQGIQVSWTGGLKSDPPNGSTGGSNFLQIMQCWGADDDSGPDRTKCQYGGLNTPGATRDSLIGSTVPADEDLPHTVTGTGFSNPTYVGIPFYGADGGSVVKVVDDNGKNVLADRGKPDPEKINLNSNQYFSRLTSNEVSWAGSGADGTGSVKFELQTAAQSPGLGCGTPEPVAGGRYVGSSCWLVVVPRGTADAGTNEITRSGLFWDSWKHRIAVKLDFLPIGVRCTIGAAERQLSGSELVSEAIASWQPSLCGAENGAAYTSITGPESDAVLAANGTGASPLALTSRALSAPDVVDGLTYAPIALTGISVAFSIDREVSALREVSDEVKGRERLPFQTLRLTPRLVAKLLTNSYLDSMPTGADKAHLGYISPEDPGPNARNITFDPEFLAINDPEWADQSITAPSVADIIVPQGRSDTARALWTYVTSDPAAAAFLAGEADEFGMKVNPWASSNADVYTANGGTGLPLTFPRDDFPKADPTEQPADEAGPTAINSVTWRPYTTDLATSANLVLRGDGQILGVWDPVAIPPKYTKASRNLAGFQRVIGLTDTSSAAKYQVFSAELLNPAGEFVAPSTESLTAAAAAMTADPAQPQVYRFDPASEAARGAGGAYPLAVPVYAAANPKMTDAELRADYAAFIDYAVTSGQEPGTGFGMLPEGYAPIPAGWRAQALEAAALIQSGPQKASTPTPVPTPAKPTTPVTAPAPAAVQPAPAPAPAVATGPSASGAAAGSLLGKTTPVDQELGGISGAVPLAILAGLLAALAVPVISRIRRRI